MSRKFTVTVICSLTLLALAGSAGAANGADRASTNWDEVKTWSHERKNEAVETGKQALAASRKELRELEAASRKAGREAQSAQRESIRALKTKMAAARRELAAARKAGVNTWASTRDRFTSAFKDLTATREKAGTAGTAGTAKH